MNEDFDEKSMRGFSEPVTQVQGGGWRRRGEGWRMEVMGEGDGLREERTAA